jgi:ASC-1-like (ASCH) protein
MSNEIDRAFQPMSYLFKLVDDKNVGIHLAIFSPPYPQLIKEQKKTIESRFSKRQIAPYHKIYKGDIVFMKQASNPCISSYFSCGEIQHYKGMDAMAVSDIRSKFGSRILADDSFWNYHEEHSLYGTLITVDKIVDIAPVFITKKDRRAWIVLRLKNHGKLDIT